MTGLYIPNKIKVGYQNRQGTYTGKLAYIIYFDEKGTLRKEGSWESWRDKGIDADEFDNKPTEGFVLNKKVGDYVSDWNHRQAYVRVYDPRNFEFEITIENLLYILANTSAIKGKGLEGEFVYSWSGKDLVLLPANTPDYTELMNVSDKINSNSFITSKQLVEGKCYKDKKGIKYMYLGRYDYHTYEWSAYNTKTIKYEQPTTKKMYYFSTVNKYGISFHTFASVLNKFIDVCDDFQDYAEIMSRLGTYCNYSKIKEKRYVPFTVDTLLLDDKHNDIEFFVNSELYIIFKGQRFNVQNTKYGIIKPRTNIWNGWYWSDAKCILDSDSLEEVQQWVVDNKGSYIEVVLENNNICKGAF